MAGLIKLFSAAVVAGSMMALTAEPAGAQAGPTLTVEQKQAVAIANGFNKCIRDGYGNPDYVTGKAAYEKALAAAEKDYEHEKTVYIEAQRAFNKAFDVIAMRDGEATLIDALNKRYTAMDNERNFAAQGVVEVQIDMLRALVQEKVKAETGMAAPDYPVSAEERVSVPAPSDPLKMCSDNLKRVLTSMKVDEWTFRSTLSDVLQSQGPDKYNEMTGGPVIR